MKKKDIEKFINLVSGREGVKEITSIIVDNFENSIKIYYTITDEFAVEYNLDFKNRVFDYNLKIHSLSHTRDYVNV